LVPNQRVQFTKVLSDSVGRCGIDVAGDVLIVGGRQNDVTVLQKVGFQRIMLSNIESLPARAQDVSSDVQVQMTYADAEDLCFGDDSYDTVFAHDVLHHCRSPHAALLEMLRVARRHIIIMEPHDSSCMKAFQRLHLATFPYELGAVRDHDGLSGGVRDSCVPNFVYRWSSSEVFKTVSSSIPDRNFVLFAHPYWDFNLDEKELGLRKETKLHIFTQLLGVRRFLAALRFLQRALNVMPVVSRQGNKFFCCIEKRSELRPWLLRNERGIVFDMSFGNKENGSNARLQAPA
jgi:SAM-dependent methyltransferase